MANNLYNQFGSRPTNNPFSQIVKDARELKRTFRGSPKDEVQRLLNSGAMSQQQFNQLSQIAQQILGTVGDDL